MAKRGLALLELPRRCLGSLKLFFVDITLYVRVCVSARKVRDAALQHGHR
ncbi:MAG: hypothetical protein WCD51_13650 [Anaerolineae bacterium]